eukprot:2467819-Rhodomonas_salina.1
MCPEQWQCANQTNASECRLPVWSDCTNQTAGCCAEELQCYWKVSLVHPRVAHAADSPRVLNENNNVGGWLGQDKTKAQCRPPGTCPDGWACDKPEACALSKGESCHEAGAGCCAEGLECYQRGANGSECRSRSSLLSLPSHLVGADLAGRAQGGGAVPGPRGLRLSGPPLFAPRVR